MGDGKLDFKKLKDWKLKDFRKWFTPDKLITGILFGALLLVIALPGDSTPKKDKQKKQGESQSKEVDSGQGGDTGWSQSGDSAYVADLESRLKAVLGQMSGVGRVEVMITLESTSEAVVNKDVPYTRNNEEEISGDQTKSSHSFESREETVMVETDGDTGPYVIKSIYPKIEGVVVVAEGAGQASIKNEIVEAIEVLFGVEPHKVKVLGME